mmetsp:Transcript_27000/g.41423  ORF Transcript_27000/g.41423 Transcript_27000/m.41423 type:complete len:373 (-) Transcript_27000:136-1254(-)|eukprot:CAMPEP_0195301254 /NCGR_PEP_ID=MMETSP0707-20130614/28951_1 /TAXON_ID=33640 /ORGANISM="Asterionellopsis glacialis, Strain CCMP134" /LENGTH=372 /DNA_ID=CAMNT_0040364145 /DNA_START=63 /DNA_END=1181 /DNA_ORIENTATION=-
MKILDIVVLGGLSLTTTTAFIPASTSFVNTQRPSTRLSESALIIQNKGGGHGELGYQIAKLLDADSRITNITLLQDVDADFDKEPFKSYPSDLPNVVVNSVPFEEWIDEFTMQNMLGGASCQWEYIFDNCSKNPTGAHKAFVDCAAKWGTVKLYCYVSSAGMYQPSSTTEFPMAEDTTPIKETAGQHLFDEYVVEKGLPLVSFRPQYIYGPKSNKHTYLDYFFDKLVNGEPIPIPGDGSQLVSLTCSEDVASLLVSPMGGDATEEAATSQRYFNCGTDQLVSYKDVAYMCAEVAGITDVQIESTGTEKSDGFPFRATNFYVAPTKAKSILGWEGSKHTLKEDLVWYYEDYKVRKKPAVVSSVNGDDTIVNGV